MPKYLVKHGSIMVEKVPKGPGSVVELTEAQAARANEGYSADSPKGLAVVPMEAPKPAPTPKDEHPHADGKKGGSK